MSRHQVNSGDTPKGAVAHPIRVVSGGQFMETSSIALNHHVGNKQSDMFLLDQPPPPHYPTQIMITPDNIPYDPLEEGGIMLAARILRRRLWWGP